MSQIEEIQVFVRVVETGGISRAAEQLGLAKSAVSRRIRKLETRLGSELITRTTRKSSLTDLGEEYYQRALKVLDDVAELNSLGADSHDELRGGISIAVPLSFGLRHLTRAIDDFQSLHPSLSVNINFSDRQLDLVEEGLDPQ